MRYKHGCPSVVNVRIIFYLNFGLSNTATADNKCTISNGFVYINNTFVQVKLKLILKYENQYFCFGVEHFNYRLSQPITGLPVDLVISRQSASLYSCSQPKTPTVRQSHWSHIIYCEIEYIDLGIILKLVTRQSEMLLP